MYQQQRLVPSEKGNLIMKLLGWVIKFIITVGSIVAALTIWDKLKTEKDPYECMQ